MKYEANPASSFGAFVTLYRYVQISEMKFSHDFHKDMRNMKRFNECCTDYMQSIAFHFGEMNGSKSAKLLKPNDDKPNRTTYAHIRVIKRKISGNYEGERDEASRHQELKNND